MFNRAIVVQYKPKVREEWSRLDHVSRSIIDIRYSDMKNIRKEKVVYFKYKSIK